MLSANDQGIFFFCLEHSFFYLQYSTNIYVHLYSCSLKHVMPCIFHLLCVWFQKYTTTASPRFIKTLPEHDRAHISMELLLQNYLEALNAIAGVSAPFPCVL